MNTFLGLIMVLMTLMTMFALPVVLIKPQLLSKILKTVPSRKAIAGYWLSAFFGIGILTGLTAPETAKEPVALERQDVAEIVAVDEASSTEQQAPELSENQAETPKVAESENAAPVIMPVSTTTESKPNATTSLSSSAPKNTETSNTSATTQAQTSVPVKTYYTVESVVDGDTVKIKVNGELKTVRLIGVDTPETVHPSKPVECFGKEASNFTKSTLTGKRIELEVDATQGTQDKYGRLLGYVIMEDGTNFSLLLIQRGFAYEYTYGTAYKYQKQFKDAQVAAKASGTGLWATNACPSETEPAPAPASTQSSGKYYTSSYSTSKYYYPDTCDAKSSIMDSKYLVSFDTLAGLQAKYSRTLSPQCE